MSDKKNQNEVIQPTRKDDGHDFNEGIQNTPNEVRDTLSPPPREDRQEPNNDKSKE